MEILGEVGVDRFEDWWTGQELTLVKVCTVECCPVCSEV